ncbi:MAG: biotin--[acetyl-CoA-carboxylase] ligase [Arenicellales bacterium]
MSKTSHHVLEILSSGNLISGESIGEMLGVSRMAVSKSIKGLCEKGLDISSVPGSGYQLSSPVQLLDKNSIHSAINNNAAEINQIEILHEISSTSDYLLELSHNSDINRRICLAESQHKGRGRRQREWVASPYRNITLSMGWRFNDGMAGLSGLGIAAGITIVRTLHEAGFDRDIGLKWPNDIVWNDSKLGGLLIDVRGEHDGPCLAVLGLGLNLSLSATDLQAIDQPCASLEQITNKPVDRNVLIADLVCALAQLFEGYMASNFEDYQRLWPGYDRLHGRKVNVTRGEISFSGVAMGIDRLGALMLDEGKQPYSSFLSGDVSLRLAE